MRIHAICFIALLLGSTASAAPSFESGPVIESKKVIAQDRKGETVAWELNDAREWRQPYAADPAKSSAFDTYREWLRSHDAETSVELIRRMMAIPGLPDADHENLERVVDGKFGELHPITALEALPFAETLTVVDLLKTPMEFSVSILEKPGRILMIGDFYHWVENGPSGSGDSPATSKLRKHLLAKEGWKWTAHYHSHPYWFQDGVNMSGILCPSEPDVMTYRKLKLPEAWISNAFDTIVMHAEDWKSYRLAMPLE